MSGNTELPGDLDIAMTDPVYVGLAVCPHAAASSATAIFDQINSFWGAIEPTPADNTVGLEYGTTTTLKWNALAYPKGAIKDWKVYFGTEPNDLTATLLGTVSEPTREITSPVLASDKTYYWRVDATQAVVGDPNTSKGFYWAFTTKTAAPVIEAAGQPKSILVAVNCSGSFSATAKSGFYADQGPMTFVWKNIAGTALKTEADVLTSSYQTIVRDTYYVEVTNKNGTTKSNEVTLGDDLGMPPFVFNAIGTGAQTGVGGSVSGSTVTIVGSGDDIWNAADGFEYAYIPVSGDGTVTARVASLSSTNTDGWSKSGVMFRETLNPNSTHAIMAVTQSNNEDLQFRTTTGGGSGEGGTGGSPAPMWVRIVRSGTTFTGYRSSDGLTWTSGGTTTISMTDPIYVGLAVCSHNTANLNTSVFDNITMTYASSGWAPTDPQYSANAVTPEKWINPVVELTASWTKSSVAPCGAIYKVYAGGSPTTMTLFGTTAPDVTQIVIPANTLPFNSTIYWRVDTISGDTTVAGTVWSFDTVKQYPVIRTQPALITVVNAGATANLNIVATTSTVPAVIPMVKYQWYKVKTGGDVKVGLIDPMPIDDGAGNFSCPLALTNVQLPEEGEYYCIVTNTIGSTTSDKGRVLTHRLMLYYKFESVTANVIADQSASGFDATLICPAGGAGVKYALVDGGLGLGKAIKLFGQNDPNNGYITTNKKPMELGISGNLPRTISVWAKADVFSESGLYDMGAYDTDKNFAIRTAPNTNNTWVCQYWGDDRSFTVNPSFQTWVHFVHVFDGVNTQIYVNGVRVVSYASPLNTDNGANVVLGRWNYDAARFAGQLDDFRLYNYALTPVEAAQLYIAVKGGPVCVIPFVGDLDGNCKVDINDFALFSAQWLTNTLTKP